MWEFTGLQNFQQTINNERMLYCNKIEHSNIAITWTYGRISGHSQNALWKFPGLLVCFNTQFCVSPLRARRDIHRFTFLARKYKSLNLLIFCEFLLFASTGLTFFGCSYPCVEIIFKGASIFPCPAVLSSDFLRNTQNLKKSSSCFGRLLSKCTLLQCNLKSTY